MRLDRVLTRHTCAISDHAYSTSGAYADRFVAAVKPHNQADETAADLGAWDRPIDKNLSMSRPCATLGGDPLRSWGRQPARRHNPISLAVAHPAKRDAETSSPVETIGRPLSERRPLDLIGPCRLRA
jgi:hypothetical protein